MQLVTNAKNCISTAPIERPIAKGTFLSNSSSNFYNPSPIFKLC